MAELNEVFIFSKELFQTLPIEDGKQSIYGVRPSYIFHGSGGQGGQIFQRDTHNSAQNGHNIDNDANSINHMNTKLNLYYQNTKEGMTKVGEKWGVLQDYLTTVSKIY